MVTCRVAFTEGSRENNKEAPPVQEEKPVDQLFRANSGMAVKVRPPFTEEYAEALVLDARKRAIGAVGCARLPTASQPRRRKRTNEALHILRGS
jgi:hypothetical protein